MGHNVKVGDRVGAFLSITPDEGSALFLGFGTYVGDEVPPNEGYQSLTSYLSGLRQSNPKIVLDEDGGVNSGEVVWGCECWWNPEAEAKAEMAKLKNVQTVSIKAARLGRIAAEKPAEDEFWGSGSPKKDDFWS